MKEITCNKCGKTFLLNPNEEIQEHIIKEVEIPCKYCSEIGIDYHNKKSELVDFILWNYEGDVKIDCDNVIDTYRLDAYIPALNLAYEFVSVYWNNELFREKKYHYDKTNKCLDKGIQLIYVWEDDWVNRKDVCKSMIINKLKQSDEKFYARKCEIKEITNSKIVSKFLDDSHVQGHIGSAVKIGLYFNNELVSLMTFGKKRKAMNSQSVGEDDYELLRFCNKARANVVGGASKIFKYFIEKYNPSEVTTYADLTYSNGNLYQQLGFDFIHITEPNYYYVVDGYRKHRFGFRKDVLVSDGYDANMTEHGIMLSRKIYRVFNSGNYKYVYKPKQYERI